MSALQILQVEYTKEIASLTARVSLLNDVICSKSIEPWEVKELKQIKLDYMKRKIQLIKILANPLIWN